MPYDYNNKKIAEYIKQSKMSARKAQMTLNMSNVRILNGWMDGGDLRVSNLLHFVNTFRLNLLDFFTLNDKPLSECVVYKPAESDATEEEPAEGSQKESLSDTEDVVNGAKVSHLVLQHVKEMAELKENHLREMFDKEKELLLREMNHEKVIRQEYETKLEAAVVRAEERSEKHWREKHAQTEMRYEQKLKEKDLLVEELRKQLTELTLQYKELEACKTGISPYPGSTIASESLQQTFSKR